MAFFFTFIGTVADETINGTPSNDSLVGNGGDDLITADAGDDAVFGDGSPTVVFPGAFNEQPAIALATAGTGVHLWGKPGPRLAAAPSAVAFGT